MNLLIGQISRFLVVGFTGAGIDFVIYRILLFVDVSVPVAKALGLIGAGVFAYFANRKFTFETHGSVMRAIGCWLLYGVSIGLNVGVNSWALALIGLSELGINLAFIMASAVSATTNFLGMRYLIFPESQRLADRAQEATDG